MNVHPVELVFRSLSGIVLPYIAEPGIMRETCSCCGRSASEFNYKGYKFK